MQKRKPGRQKWGNCNPPSDEEIAIGKEGFRRNGVLDSTEKLAKESALFPLYVGPRTQGAKTAPRCYLYIDRNTYENGYENIACVDCSKSSVRLIIRPIGRSNNRVLLLTDKNKLKFVKSDKPGWLHMKLDNGSAWNTAIDALRQIKSEYLNTFAVG